MKTIADLGSMPLVNNLFQTFNESINANRYPLRIIEDNNKIMRLDTVVPPDQLFTNYLYRSSVNKPYIQHCKNMWNDINKYKPKIIADIGGNDGALLNTFQENSTEKLDLYNIDPSISFIEDNQQKNINYINSYWGDIKINQIFDLIVSTNVFQHGVDYDKFLKGIVDHLDGRWILEFPYFLETVKSNQFDQIYHEHIYYWLVYPLYHIFKKYGLKIIDISYQNIHGGSLRIISSNKKEDKENIPIINYFIDKEMDYNFDEWNNTIQTKIIKDKEFINSLHGKTAVFGAAAKGCIYMNSLKLSYNDISYIIDDTKEKQNMYSPMTGLQIMDRSIIKTNPVDNIIILAHNFKDYMMKSIRDYGFNGKIFVMFPEIQELS
jgi:2-polyprenyl-3-methyl-5-hydroxy-6-metoxy-1,4-benzoquinol methylase